jgi:hypothetical protein
MVNRLIVAAIDEGKVHADSPSGSQARIGQGRAPGASLPEEVRCALAEMRAWRAALLEAYERLPSAERPESPHITEMRGMQGDRPADVRLS